MKKCDHFYSSFIFACILQLSLALRMVLIYILLLIKNFYDQLDNFRVKHLVTSRKVHFIVLKSRPTSLNSSLCSLFNLSGLNSAPSLIINMRKYLAIPPDVPTQNSGFLEIVTSFRCWCRHNRFTLYSM